MILLYSALVLQRKYASRRESPISRTAWFIYGCIYQPRTAIGKTSDRRHITYLRSSSRRRQFLAPRNERARFGEILRDFRLSSSHYWGHLFVAAATMKLCRSPDKSMTGVTVGGGGWRFYTNVGWERTGGVGNGGHLPSGRGTNILTDKITIGLTSFPLSEKS